MATAHAPARRKKHRSNVLDNGRQPTWDLVRYLPHQGEWTEDEYLELEGVFGNHIRAELVDGRLEVLPVPTDPHQLIMVYLWKCLDLFIAVHAPGVALVSGTRVRLVLRTGIQFREPDVVYMSARNAGRRRKEFWNAADLVMEVVSGSSADRKRDWVEKVKEYAAAGIPEYWIIDPKKKVIRVLSLRGKSYRRHDDFKPGDEATSVLLPGFAVAVDAVFAAAEV